MKIHHLYCVVSFIALVACQPEKNAGQEESAVSEASKPALLKPIITTEPARYDTDDPAIWVNSGDPSKSLIIGTDKGGDTGDGALYVYDLNGKIIEEKTVRGIARPNNVDIAYGFQRGGQSTDIAVCTERYTHSLRIFTLPDMKPINNGGLPVFEGESLRDPMGVSLYTNPADGKIYAIVGRKAGPQDGTYLWQYLLEEDGTGNVKATLVRKFGAFSGKEEIEAIAVDNALGYVYYADEGTGIRKYYAHPDSSNVQLAIFGENDVTRDHEGVSIYQINDGTGYIIVSDQQANKFHLYTREGGLGNPHAHQLVKTIDVSTIESDGNEVTSASLNHTFVNGLFIAMSDDKTFQLYKWEAIAGDDLKVARDGVLK